MKAIISNSFIAKIKPSNKQYEIRDSKLMGFLIRVNPSGKMNYICEYRRGKRITIGKVNVLTPNQARDRAKEILGDSARGIDLKAEIIKKRSATLKLFIEGDYKKWALTHRRRGEEATHRISINFFNTFAQTPLTEITANSLEKWRISRLESGTKAATVNRDIAVLKASISKAVEWGVISTHPLAKFKPIKTDKAPKVRYLTTDEENQLRHALDEREVHLRQIRENGNQWRKERGYDELPSLDTDFANYLKPMVLISLNTGLRRGELLSLRWENVNFLIKTITIEGADAKSELTRHIPLNNEAYETFIKWKAQTENDNGFVFLNKSGKQLNGIKKSWATLKKNAQINNFRWHDMRHHFASCLVMAGVDLNTVRELLGHADLKTTLRYAHLAPEHKAAAVAKLDALRKKDFTTMENTSYNTVTNLQTWSNIALQ